MSAWSITKQAKVASRALLIAVVLLSGAIVGLFFRGESTRNIVTKSPCQSSPESAACAKVREGVARAEPIENPCISYQRVTGRRGANCPGRFVGEVVVVGGSNPSGQSRPGGGGDHGTTGGGTVGGGGTHGQDGSNGQNGSNGSNGSAGPPGQAAPDPVGDTVKQVQGAVDQVQGIGDNTVDGVQGLLCQQLHNC